ncbi:MAG: chromate resistance protein ChrB domain-containing protein [Gammaproteobacteria bacterium]
MLSSKWLVFVLSLPGSNAASRMRVWRGLKALGAGVLRDGVYLLPSTSAARESFLEQAGAVDDAGGTAQVLECTSADEGQERAFRGLFDRSDGYEGWTTRAAGLRDALADLDEAGARREEAQLRRSLAALEGVDYFPGEARTRARRSLADLSATINSRFSPGEPTPTQDEIRLRAIREYQGRLWATRRQLWVDRVACAWLIRRFIDPNARFEWLHKPEHCPPGALGFDFDGAEFTHAGHRVSFEVLLASFDLESDRALVRIGTLVHYLDTGGVPVPEASGFVALLGGARRRCADDDAFLDAAGGMLDDLYTAYADSNLAAAQTTGAGVGRP